MARKTLGRFPTEGVRLLNLAMRERGLNQRRVSELTGIDDGAVARICYGDRRVSLSYGIILRDKFEIPTDAWIQKPRGTITLPSGAKVSA